MEMKEKPREDRKEPIPGEYGHPIPRELMLRELGFNGPFSRHSVGKKIVSHTLATKAVHTMCTKELSKRRFKLPSGARTTFHMAFSAEGTKVASCHGDHNVYVCDVATGEVIQTLSGHPRTPWCVVFHPTQNDILASGCLAGHVRVWDLNGGSEMLVTDSGTVIASLAFHPTVRVLAIATFNEIIFWDWSLPYPLARCSTENTKEKVRLVRFDRLGRSLITGITNFPSPPYREGLSRVRGNGGPFFRPNILSRSSQRNFSHPNSVELDPPTPPYVPRRTNDSQDDPDDIDPDDEPDPGPDGEVAALAASIAAAAEDDSSVADALSDRQDRFQESYRQLVNHYQDLVTHYQQFLRSRIPRLLENSRNVRSQPLAPPIVQSDSLVSSVSSSDSSVSSSTTDDIEMDIATAPVLSDGISDMVRNHEAGEALVIDDEMPGPSRLMQLEARLLAHIEAEAATSPSNSETTADNHNAIVVESTNASNSSNSNSERRDTDLRSIEALAQNILEMQNLCSQARRDAPLTIETQHIIELQNIRRHLEILQEQTRELQSSIRATLSSLASGSLAALRSHCNTSGSNGSPNPIEAPTMNPSSQTQNVASPTPLSGNSGSSRSNAGNSAELGDTTTDGNTASRNPQNSSNPGTFFRITIGPGPPYPPELGRVSPPNLANPNVLNRIRVPPMVTMQYDIADGFYRTRPTLNPSRSTDEPIPSTSREPTNRNGGSNNSNNEPTGSAPGPRRIVREFHVVGGRPGGENEHARNCPFSGRDTNPLRPPPRMRCLAEMGETPTLTVWPTIETGLEAATRSFRNAGLGPIGNSLRSGTVARTNSSSTNNSGVYNVAESAFYHNNNNHHNNTLNYPWSHWFQGGHQWVPNDVGVSVFLTVRQAGDSSSATRPNRESEEVGGDSNQNEHWQRLFSSGLALVPPGVRQGQRTLRRRRGPGILCNLGSGASRGVALNQLTRPSQWDDFRSNLPSSSSSNGGSGLPTGGNSPRREIPGRLEGNFVRVFYMRMVDELIPVYSHLAGNAEPATTSEVRDGIQPNVYLFPIGLFLQGSAWEGNTQTIGIYWPPGSRDEEESLAEFRRTEGLIPIYSRNSRETGSSGSAGGSSQSFRYRIQYDSSTMQIFLPRGFSLHFIQTGLSILDAVTTAATLPRPRATEGTIYIDHVSPLLDALERLFGHRVRRLNQSTPLSSGARLSTAMGTGILGRNPPWTHGLNINRNQSGNSTSTRNLGSSHSSVQNEPPQAVGESSDAYARRLAQAVEAGLLARHRLNPRRIITFANDAPNYRAGAAGTAASASGDAEDSTTRRRIYAEIADSDQFSGIGEGAGGARTFLFGNSSNRLRPDYFPGPPTSESQMDIPDHSRRVIRLAVDTAAAELLRRQQIENHGPGGPSPSSIMSRAIESRIERVLNERGNRGLSSSPPSTNSNGGSSTSGHQTGQSVRELNQSRYDDIQMRISMLAQWSRARAVATSGTQTPQSFLSSTTTTETANASGSVEQSTSGRSRTNSPDLSSLSTQLSNAGRGGDASSTTRAARYSPDIVSIGTTRHRRRPYPRSNSSNNNSNGTNNGNNSDDDIAPPLPPRIARMSTSSSSDNLSERNNSVSNRPEGGRGERETYMNQEVGRMASLVPYGEHWVIRRQRVLTPLSGQRQRAGRSGDQFPLPTYGPFAPVTQPFVELSGSARTRAAASNNNNNNNSSNNNNNNNNNSHTSSSGSGPSNSNSANIDGDEDNRPSTSSGSINVPLHPVTNRPVRMSNDNSNNNNNNEEPLADSGARFYPGYIPEILITPRARPPTYYTMDAATTAFLSSRIQKWDFSQFFIPDITKRDEFVVVRECSLHSDACLDVSSDSDFLAVLQPSDNGSYSAVGIYSLRDETLGDSLFVYHFDQNTVSVSISPSCDYIVVGYAGRGPLYRFVHPSRNIGQILSLTRDDEKVKLVAVKELFADSQSTLMSINCMHWVPVPGYGIIYGTNTGELVLLS